MESDSLTTRVYNLLDAGDSPSKIEEELNSANYFLNGKEKKNTKFNPNKCGEGEFFVILYTKNSFACINFELPPAKPKQRKQPKVLETRGTFEYDISAKGITFKSIRLYKKEERREEAVSKKTSVTFSEACAYLSLYEVLNHKSVFKDDFEKNEKSEFQNYMNSALEIIENVHSLSDYELDDAEVILKLFQKYGLELLALSSTEELSPSRIETLNSILDEDVERKIFKSEITSDTFNKILQEFDLADDYYTCFVNYTNNGDGGHCIACKVIDKKITIYANNCKDNEKRKCTKDREIFLFKAP